MNKKLSILLVGNISDNPKIYTYASSFARALLTCGYDVTTFNNKKKLLKSNNRYIQKLSHVINNYYSNYKLTKKVSCIKPDILFLIKPDSITPKAVSNIKKLYNPLIIAFHPDNPFAFWNGNANANFLRSLNTIDHVLCWSKMLMPALKSAGCKNIDYFPFAFDDEIFSQNLILSQQEQEEYISDVCFIGTWEPEREQWLTKIVEKIPTINLAIWGNNWHENLDHKSILHNYIKNNAIYTYDMIKAFRSSKIVLNFIRQQNMTSHNMRTFEVPASKAFILTQRTYEQAEFLFTEDENLACFETVDELIKKIAFYLSNDTLRKQMAEKAFAHVQQFSLVKQLDYFMNNIDKGDEL